jgi:hypothetical protein
MVGGGGWTKQWLNVGEPTEDKGRNAPREAPARKAGVV